MNIVDQLRNDAEQWRGVGNFNIAQVMTSAADKIDALQHRVTSLQRLLDQRWQMMRELEEYIKWLKARVKRLEDAGDALTDPWAVGEKHIKAWNAAKDSNP